MRAADERAPEHALPPFRHPAGWPMKPDVRLKVGRLARTRTNRAPAIAATTNAHGSATRESGPLALLPAAASDHLLLLVDALAPKRLLTPLQRAAARKRVRRATVALARQVGGLEALRGASTLMTSPVLTGQLRALAAEWADDLALGVAFDTKRALALFADALAIAAAAVSDLALVGDTALAWAALAGTWVALAAQATGRAGSLRPDPVAKTLRERTAQGGTMTVGGSSWPGLLQVAASASGRAEFALEAARRASDTFRAASASRDAELARAARLARIEEVTQAEVVIDEHDDGEHEAAPPENER